MVTKATAVAASSSSVSLAPSIAAMAHAPQMENPAAVNSARSRDSPNRSPTQRVTTKPSTTVRTTTSSNGTPSPASSSNDSWRPKKTTPAGSNRRVETAKPVSEAELLRWRESSFHGLTGTNVELVNPAPDSNRWQRARSVGGQVLPGVAFAGPELRWLSRSITSCPFSAR